MTPDDGTAGLLRRAKATSERNAAPRPSRPGAFLGTPGVPELLRLALRLVPVLLLLVVLRVLGVPDAF